MAKTVNLHAAKTHLSRLVDEAVGGEGFGADRGRIWVSDDFDAPLPRAVLRAFGVRR